MGLRLIVDVDWGSGGAGPFVKLSPRLHRARAVLQQIGCRKDTGHIEVCARQDAYNRRQLGGTSTRSRRDLGAASP